MCYNKTNRSYEKIVSKIVLITGASSGYGKATARAFKNNGDTVIMTARNKEKT